MTRNDAYLTVVEGWLRDNRGIVFTYGAVDDLCDRVASVLADNARLRAALQAMLECHGKPHREEWINDAAYQHAIEVDAQARRALEPKQ